MEVARLWGIDPADVERMDVAALASYVGHAQLREQIEDRRFARLAEAAVARVFAAGLGRALGG